MKLASEIRQHFGYKVEEHEDYLTVWIDSEGRKVDSEEIKRLMERLISKKDVKWVRLSRPERIILNSQGSRIGLILYVYLMGRTLWNCPSCGAKRKQVSSHSRLKCPVCHSTQMVRSGVIMQKTVDLRISTARSVDSKLPSGGCYTMSNWVREGDTR